MFDGHALLVVIVAAGWFTCRWINARTTIRDDPRTTLDQPPRPFPVVCGDCGAELCTAMTVLDAAIEDEAHHLIAHAGGAR